MSVEAGRRADGGTDERAAPGRAPPRRRDWPALAIAGGFLLLAGIVLVDARHIAGMSSYARVGPTAFPYAIAACLAAASAGLAREALRGAFLPREPLEWPPVLWIVGGLAAQMLLIGHVGFSIASGLVFAGAARAFGRSPLWLTLPVGIALSFAVYVLFAKGLQLSLPAGPLERLI
ncbi:tripartite tricarboxylate transporter TctB family protein [Ancylobacter terrae]|uniref:tripartite tricarboxylate transporter TctB family protein n=1 Tax=Ancylobacter sp. sgz301288 TaxID=3342077 RepID=UPI00385F562F